VVGKVVFMSAPGVVTVGVGNYGPAHGAVGIDVHIGLLAVQAFFGVLEQVRQSIASFFRCLGDCKVD
jgi:hypothetical protein